MGSDLGVRSLDGAPVRPLDPTGARARRTLAASAAARTGIATMVDALRISKPPRAPPRPPHAAAAAARRHALIPLAEGRAELEARIRALEDAVARRDADALKLKKQLGRALVRRRHLHTERDALSARLAAAVSAAAQSYAALVAARADLATFVEDVDAPVAVVRASADNHTGLDPRFASDLRTALDDVTSALDIARRKLAHPPAEPALEPPAQPPPVPAAAAAALARARPVRPASSAGSDDDAKSCASFASSTALGDDRDTQLDTLTELVELLDAKLSAGPPHPGAAAVSRARRTIAEARGDPSQIAAERDRLKDALDAVMKEKQALGGEDAALAAAAKAEADLREARVQMEEMRQRLVSVEKIAERVVKAEELAPRNAALEAELKSAKKTVGRLVQERNSLRRTTPNTPSNSTTSAMKGPLRGNSDAMKRILDWRQRASSENHPPPQPVFDDVADDDGGDHDYLENMKNGRIDRRDALPDRLTTELSRKGPSKKRRMGAFDSDSVNTNDNQSLSESLDVGVNDSASAQSLPVQGFLRRHDSFMSAGGVSASNDEITITNNRNIFNSRAPRVDGLRGLLGGS